MEDKLAVAALGALAHEGRLGVLRLLVQAGTAGVAAGEVARRMGVPPNSLSANLSILSHAGLVESRREGRSIIYTAAYPRMTALLAYLVGDCCQGSPAICAPLAAILAETACCPVAATGSA